MNKIVVLQNTEAAVVFFNYRLNFLGFNPEEFEIHQTPELCLEAIKEGFQILVTGIVDESREKTEQFITEARKKNPQLQVLGYTSGQTLLDGTNVGIDAWQDNYGRLLGECIQRWKEQYGVIPAAK